MTQLSSSSNPKIKLIRALRQRKQRQATGLFVVEGIRHVGEASQAADTSGVSIELEAEFPSYKNDTSIRPASSRSLGVTPYDTYKLMMNTLGGESWKASGSTILPGAICENLTSLGGVLREGEELSVLQDAGGRHRGYGGQRRWGRAGGRWVGRCAKRRPGRISIILFPIPTRSPDGATGIPTWC